MKGKIVNDIDVVIVFYQSVSIEDKQYLHDKIKCVMMVGKSHDM